jgi:hypothetical protein
MGWQQLPLEDLSLVRDVSRPVNPLLTREGVSESSMKLAMRGDFPVQRLIGIRKKKFCANSAA